MGTALGYQRSGLSWVWVLGVRLAWRRRSVGPALLQQMFACFYGRGTPSVGPGVDATSPTGATRLYERAGKHPVAHLDKVERLLYSLIDVPDEPHDTSSSCQERRS